VNSQQRPSVLFVCLGNICRSPTAEGIFRTKALKSGIELNIDSAGTAGYKTGAPPDQRSQKVAAARGYDLSALKCRKISEEDFENFDYIVAMDHDNVRDLKRKCPEDLQHKITLFMSHTDSEYDEIPDPYYAGMKGFELVLDLIEEASEGLLLKMVP
jgi:protein-tyrosine phosphatase